MYSAKIITDAGKTFNFGYQYGTLFDISPLSGNDVTIATSQGTGQIGTTIEEQSIGGINRTITGLILDKATANRMLSYLPAFTTGRLFVNNTRYCDIAISKTPEISYKKNGKMLFTMRVYCSTPFWREESLQFFNFGGVVKKFSFPVVYNSHKFGEITKVQILNVLNNGDVSTPIKCVFTSKVAISNYGIIDTNTLEKLVFNDTLNVGETTTVYFENNKLYAFKKDVSGDVIPFILAITDDSSLFKIKAGDNILALVADDHEEKLFANISFCSQYMGVVV